jgi:DnaJ-class molecular chaperone
MAGKWKERENPPKRTSTERGQETGKERTCQTCKGNRTVKGETCPACKGEGGINLRVV